jgi:tetratricopeptide (TPR) repeat protein
MSILTFRSLSVAAIAATLAIRAASAQQESPDAVFNRARQLVVNGNGAGGRLLIDSVITATPPDSPVFGDALYWRAALAATNTDAERDYRRMIVEYPLSSHVGDALFALAQLENAGGDKAAAATHLEQFLADNPSRPERPRATLLYVKLLLDLNQMPRGCSALRQTISQIPDTLVETRNQLEFYLPRCVASDVTPGGAAPIGAPGSASTASGRSTARDTTRASSTPTVSPKARYTLQVAAYKTRADAEALVQRLKARKIDDARVVATPNLYRVRIGHYVTKAGAAAAQRELKAKKIDAFVTDTDMEPK